MLWKIHRFAAVALAAISLTLVACDEDEVVDDEEATIEEAAGDETTAEALDAGDPNVIRVSVPTMQCESCAMTITDALQKLDPEAVDVSVEEKAAYVKVANNNEQTRSEVERAIAEAGYSTDNVERNPEAYAELPDCCKEGGMEGQEKAAGTEEI